MAQHRIILGILVFISVQFGSVSTQSPNVCKTFGSGVIQTFNKTMFYVKSTCPLILTHFSHAGVDCFISVQRDQTGIIKKVEILVNKIATIIEDGVLTVEGNSISLPYDHTYQSVYKFGIYTRLTSKVLPLSVTWYSVPEGVTSLWVQLDRPLVDGMTGMCGGLNSSETQAQLLDSNVIHDGICATNDPQPVEDPVCKEFTSWTRECLGKKRNIFERLCKLNTYSDVRASVKCSFYEEFLHLCNGSNHLQSQLRNTTSCKEHQCPGNLLFKDQGAAFPPTCSNPQLQTEFLTSTCLPQNGLVLNDRAEGYPSVKVEDCPCVLKGITYDPGQRRSSKCQTCQCIKGKWICSANTCPTLCVIEGWFVTTFDGKQYSLPGKCTYVAAKGLNWTVTIKFSDMIIEEMYLDVYQERYTFSLNSVQLGENKITITDLSQTEHATVYWQSSMFVKVQTSFGMKMQVQVSPEVQMYMYLPQSVTTTGLCGSNNNNTEDDFTTSSGIVENSAQPFALSWTLGVCTANNPHVCINTDNEIFAEDKCSHLTNTSGVFAQCHDYVPVNTYFDACIQRTCQSTSALQERACVGLGNYAKACASQGINIGDWRAETACAYSCDSNLRFDYAMQACNHTCRSLSSLDPTCDMPDDPVEGCGCPSGTHLNTPLMCSPRALCHCHYPGGTTPPGPVVIDGRQCMCENGNLQCSDVCDCPRGQICVHCAQTPVNTAQRTCESLSKLFSSDETCISGCYCPEGQYTDHTGSCVAQENCTCKFSGVVYTSGQSVESNCKTCTCRGGQWDCYGDPCPGVCEVFGNGQYKTFDSKWYRFDGHCQYTLVEDIYGLFSIKAESVPCCDEVLTCSRSISLKLKDEVTLILRDMNVTQKLLDGWHVRAQALYSVHTVGLYIIISVPELGLNVIWDKQTKIKIELQVSWNGKVRGLCGDFDGKLINDLLTSSSTVVFSTLEFGNSWKTAVPPCSDVTQELFPCERHSYCAAWAQRRCMIIHSDTFKACHLKVDPAPYYQACILESCSCDFEGKFLGFCTAVAAYADACMTQNVCIKWRTPDLCPVYCDYYNEEGQCSWHYEACPQQIKTCGKNNKFSGKLEGCYPRCPAEMPYYDENRRICSNLDSCTCYFNNTIIEPGAKVSTPTECCDCIGGQMICDDCSPTTTTTPVITLTTEITTVPKTTTPITTTETTVTPSTTTVYTRQTTPLDIIIGTISTLSSPGTQKSNNTTSTPVTTTTTEKPTTITPLTTITTETTVIATTTTSTPEITTEESSATTPLTTTETTITTTPTITTVPNTTTFLTTASTKTPVMTTTTLEITTEESSPTTPLIVTSTITETIVTTSTTEITTEESSPTTPLTTTETTITTTPTITTVPNTTTFLTTASTKTPVMTTTTLEITTEESSPTTPLIVTSTITETIVTTSTTEITTEEYKTTTPLTTTESTITTTPTITTAPNTTTSLTTALTNTPVLTTTTPEITTEEFSPTTPLIVTSSTSETPVATSTTEITTEEPKSTTPITTTETTITTTPTITSVPNTTTSLTTALTKTPVMTTKTIPEITTEKSASTIPLTTTSTITETIVTTSATEITTEEYKTTTPLTTTETTITTTPTITTIPNTTTSLTTALTNTPVMTTTTPEITTEESSPTTPLIVTSSTSETPVATSTTEITTKGPKSTTALTTTETTITTTTPTITTVPNTTTSLTTALTKTPVMTTETTPEITTEEYTSTIPLTTTSAITETTSITTSSPEITTEKYTTTEIPVTTSTTENATVPNTTTPQTTASTKPRITTTTFPRITTEESSPTTPLIVTLSTSETPVTTSTTEITTEKPKTTTTLTTTETPITTTIYTPETTTTKTIEEHTTTTPITTETPVTTTSILETTTVPASVCKDLIRNQTWPEGYQWTEDCFNKICTNSVIELRPVTCPTPVVPVCPRGMPQLVKDEQGCCDTWQCDCQCDVFGDPHYTTFAGQDFDFLENCTYILVEERTPHHHLSISVDNYYCEPSASCAKGIILKYQNNTVTVQVLQVLQDPDDMLILETTLNQVPIQPPYQADGLRFESTDEKVYIYIEEIRSKIFLSVWNTLQINLGMEHFFNNTQGQCGVCGGASCIRRDGSVESVNCCDKTAYEWIEDDPLKPYCKQAPRHVPCFPDNPPPTPPAPHCTAPLCELLRHEVFSECSVDIDIEKLVSNCKFDYCVAHSNNTVCSSLERLADHCKKMDFCVAWRDLTNGICDISCPEGMIFDDCRSTPTEYCRGGERVLGTDLDTVRSGCFCPDNQLLAESHKKICVSECTYCKGPLGEPMPVGAIWESNCHMCTCNNQSRTEECWPKPSAPTPICGPDSALISDCCNNQICVQKTCEHNGAIYKVGETWRDPQSPCATFHCTIEGTEIEKSVCPQQFCPEELRVWDKHHCCYSCNTTCEVRLSKVTIENCTQEVTLPNCEGTCAPGSLWVRSGTDLMLAHNHFCCKEKDYEIRQISLVCSGATATQYTYKHITSCECQREV